MSDQTTNWQKPTEIDNATLIFPANALDLMPSRQECEAALDAMPAKQSRKWIDFQRTWFFDGLPGDVKFVPRKSIDTDVALKHLSAIQGSFAPKHEHKEAAVAYLASLWFKDVRGFR